MRIEGINKIFDLSAHTFFAGTGQISALGRGLQKPSRTLKTGHARRKRLRPHPFRQRSRGKRRQFRPGARDCPARKARRRQQPGSGQPVLGLEDDGVDTDADVEEAWVGEIRSERESRKIRSESPRGDVSDARGREREWDRFLDIAERILVEREGH